MIENTPEELQKQALRTTMTTCDFLSERAPALIPQPVVALSSVSRSQSQGWFPSSHSFSSFSTSREQACPLSSHGIHRLPQRQICTRTPHHVHYTRRSSGTRAPHITFTTREALGIRAPHHTKTHFQLPSWFQQKRRSASGHSVLGSTFQLVIVSLDFLWILTCTFLRILFSSLFLIRFIISFPIISCLFTRQSMCKNTVP